MRIGETATSMATAGERPRNHANGRAQSRSLVPVEPASAPARPRGHLCHRSSAFLAHLSLQYDGIAARRRARLEKLDAAVSSYGDSAGRARFPAHGRAIHLKI